MMLRTLDEYTVSPLAVDHFCHNTENMDRYKGYISSYVDKCPFNLFDTRRQRNISRSELEDDIFKALGQWIKTPLTCSEVVDIIMSELNKPFGAMDDEDNEPIQSYVSLSMMKSPVIEGEARFLSALDNELQAYNTMCHQLCKNTPLSTASIIYILQQVRGLFDVKRKQTSIPSHYIHEQIVHFGQYAILSHRWCQDGQELSFNDASNLSDPTVQVKQGFKKLAEFSKVVTSYYGCRYLWVDSLCIQEMDQNVSIPLMFGWYCHAHICVVMYGFEWRSRGWTLQEFLAASKIKFFVFGWRPDQPHIPFDIGKGGHGETLLLQAIRSQIGKWSYIMMTRNLALITDRMLELEEVRTGACPRPSSLPCNA